MPRSACLEAMAMRNVHIVTDSNCHIPSALCQELEIHVVPLPFTWDGVTYLDVVDMGHREFYSKLRSSKSLPVTSAPTPGSFKEVFENLSSDGRPILAILVGKQFSSTSVTAQLAREMLPDARILLVDSESNATGLGFQVLAAARAAREGKDLDELISIANQAKDVSGVLFSVTDLEYMRRGGRIGLAKSLLASTLRLDPILEIKSGPVTPVEQVRTSRRVIPRLLDLVEERLVGGRPYRLAVLHADVETRAWNLMSAARDRFDPDEMFVSELNPILGIHVGPGAIGLAYSSGL